MKKWEQVLKTFYCTTLAAFRRKTPQNSDCFYATCNEMIPVIEAKCATMAEYKHSPSEKSLHTLRMARSNVQQTARCCVNKYWQELSENIQIAAETGNIRGMYYGIKKAFDTTQSKTAPLRSSCGKMIMDINKKMERWVRHYTEIYSSENSAISFTPSDIETLPSMDEVKQSQH